VIITETRESRKPSNAVIFARPGDSAWLSVF